MRILKLQGGGLTVAEIYRQSGMRHGCLDFLWTFCDKN